MMRKAAWTLTSLPSRWAAHLRRACLRLELSSFRTMKHIRGNGDGGQGVMLRALDRNPVLIPLINDREAQSEKQHPSPMLSQSGNAKETS